MNILSSRAKASISLFLMIMWLPLFSCSSSRPLEPPGSEPLKRDVEYPYPDEKIIFSELAHHITEIQDHLKVIHPKHQVLRGFHAKSHGCLKGLMKVLPLAERHVDPRFAIEPKDPEMRVKSAETLFGVFSQEGREYTILARFSNGVGFIQQDAWADVRGLAIKLLEVEGERVTPLSPEDPDPYPEQHTQDFVMTNNPTQLASTAQDFMEFGKDQDSMTRASWFLSKKWRSLKLLMGRLLFHRVDSVVNEQYWSDAPIRLGKRAIKYTAQPCSTYSSPVWFGENRLTKDLVTFNDTKSMCFDFKVQFQLDPYKQRMEDALTEWDEDDTPFVTVAKISFEPKQLKQTKGCEDLRFTPWHALAEHQPLGNMNRGRRYVYASSQTHRGADHREPDKLSLDLE